MTNSSADPTANKAESTQSGPTLSYKGPISGLRGLLTNKITEGLSNVVSSVTEMTHRKSVEGGTERIAIEKIYPAADQPRQVFEPKALEELSQTLREVGQAQAITVRRTPQGFEIISGERRYRAAKLAGFTELDCVVKDCSPREAHLLALVENIQRQDLLPVEEAHYLKKVLAENPDMSLERLAKSLGSHKSTLSEKIQLTEVPEDLEPYLYSKGKHLTHRHWRVISRISDPAFLRETFIKAMEHQLSVAELERVLEAAGVHKAPRRRGPATQTEPGEDKQLSLFRAEGGLFRFRSGSFSIEKLSSDSRLRLADEFEKAAQLLRSPS